MKVSLGSARASSSSSGACRLCLCADAKNQEQHSRKIFAEGEASELLRRRILDCCPVEVRARFYTSRPAARYLPACSFIHFAFLLAIGQLVEHAALPNAICADCQKKLAATYEFREQCRQSEHALRLLYRSCYANSSQRCGVDATDGPRERVSCARRGSRERAYVTCMHMCMHTYVLNGILLPSTIGS